MALLHNGKHPARKLLSSVCGSKCAWSSLGPHPRPLLQGGQGGSTPGICARGMASSLYDVLEVTPKASQAQVKTAYYKLSKLYHPDVNDEQDARTKFTKISEAYEVLGNPRTRRQYDRGLIRPTGGGFPGVTEETDIPSSFIKNRGQFGKRPNTPFTGSSDIYDFDEFYRNHYGDTIRMTHGAKEARDRHINKVHNEKKSLAKTALFMFSLIALGMAYAASGHGESHSMKQYRNEPNKKK